MSTIIEVHAREILDSRGNPTVEAEVVLSSGAQGRAAVPSGASTGEHEAVELRDGDTKRYAGKGVTEAVRNVNEVLGPRLEGMAAADQIAVDAEMMDADGTPNKAKLGANAILSVSLAVARAAAQDCGLPLYRYLGGPMARVMPVPMMNILNGGAHASNNVDAQEFMVVPVGADNFPDALRIGGRGLPRAQEGADQDGAVHRGGRRGRFRPDAALQRGGAGRRHAGDSGRRAIEPGADVAIALDVAASELFQDGEYVFKKGDGSRALGGGDGRPLRRAGWTGTPSSPSRMVWPRTTGTGWALLTERLRERVQLVGDDIFVTNVDRLGRGIEEGVGNAVLVKVNQIGTLTETLQCIELARGSAYGVVISHRSGETEDTFIADLAVATGAGQIKTGSASRTDRTAKYNQLLRICRGAGRAGPLSGPGPLPAVTPARWFVLAALAFALYFALQGGEYATARSASSCGARRRRASAGRGGLSAMVDSLRAAPTAIEHDPRVQERVARERFGMLREGRVRVSPGAADVRRRSRA